jgi:hypothetical protein
MNQMPLDVRRRKVLDSLVPLLEATEFGSHSWIGLTIVQEMLKHPQDEQMPASEQLRHISEMTSVPPSRAIIVSAFALILKDLEL